MPDSQEYAGEPLILIEASGARYIGMISRVLKDGRVDAKVMFTDLGYGWELIGKPWRKRFPEMPEVIVISDLITGA